MEAASLWAGVRFTARNGSPEALLTDAAGQGLHLYGVFSLPGGFYGHCAAWQYRRLAALARHRRVRLRVEKRHGLYFLLRPLLRRKGLWTGLVAWGLVLLWLQGLIWAVDYGSLTTGQRARAGAQGGKDRVVAGPDFRKRPFLDRAHGVIRPVGVGMHLALRVDIADAEAG